MYAREVIKKKDVMANYLHVNNAVVVFDNLATSVWYLLFPESRSMCILICCCYSSGWLPFVSSLSVGYFTDATSYETINFHAKNLVKNVLPHYLVICH